MSELPSSDRRCFRCGEAHWGYGCPRDFKVPDETLTHDKPELASKDVVPRLETWGIDDADSEALYALLADAARELKDLQQFRDWAEPQVHDHGRDVLEIERLRGELQASEQAETNAFRNRDSAIAENERLRSAYEAALNELEVTGLELIEARSARETTGDDAAHAERTKRRNDALSELGWTASAVAEVWGSPVEPSAPQTPVAQMTELMRVAQQPSDWYCPNCDCDLCGAVQGRLEGSAVKANGEYQTYPGEPITGIYEAGLSIVRLGKDDELGPGGD